MNDSDLLLPLLLLLLLVSGVVLPAGGAAGPDLLPPPASRVFLQRSVQYSPPYLPSLALQQQNCLQNRNKPSQARADPAALQLAIGALALVIHFSCGNFSSIFSAIYSTSSLSPTTAESELSQDRPISCKLIYQTKTTNELTFN